MLAAGSIGGSDSATVEVESVVSPVKDAGKEGVCLRDLAGLMQRAGSSANSQVRSDIVHCEHTGRRSSHFSTRQCRSSSTEGQFYLDTTALALKAAKTGFLMFSARCHTRRCSKILQME